MTVSYEGSEYHFHSWDPFILKFSENFGIRWYGFAYVLGFLTASWLLAYYFKKGKSPFDKEQQFNVLLILIAGVMLGGRLGYMVLYDLDTLVKTPWKIIQVWKGGMASHGGIVGLVAGVAYVSRRYKLEFWKVADLTVTLGPAGVLLVLVYLQWRFWKSRIVTLRPGQLSGEFFMLYAVVRILGEQFREPDADLILGLSRGTFYSAVMLITGIMFVVRARSAQTAVSGKA
jgi:phosphatidylglycerol---prolipoprotein diacylglyceryl transferase